MGVPIYCGLMALLIVALVLIALPLSRHRRPTWLLAAALFFTLYSVALTAPSALHVLRVGRWNWSGKTLAILLCLCSLPLLRLSPQEIGLHLPKDRQAKIASAIGLGLVPLLSAADGVFVTPMPYDLQHLAFEASMPGLDEEFAFRGILFALLLRGFSMGRPDRRSLAIAMSLVTALFWLTHVVTLSGDRILLDFNKPEVLAASILLIWIRIRSGSLIVCAAAHNLDNVLNVVIGGMI